MLPDTPTDLPHGVMHAGEVQTDAALVRRLIAGQFPQWASLPITRVGEGGSSHALYRLGDALVARLPRVEDLTTSGEKQRRWLPVFAPRLPLAIPEPLAWGEPSEGYPWRWGIYRWLVGEDATAAPLADPREAATDLARFILALRGIDATDGPPPGEHNFYRGAPLAERDEETREAIATLDAALGATFDAEAATAAWGAALRAPVWNGPPIWSHGDLLPGNLLVAGGRLSGALDWEGLGVGDPACDLLPAWSLFSPDARAAFREALGVDAAEWARGRGWALSVGLIALPYYETSNPILAGVARRAIMEVLDEWRTGGARE